MTPNYKIVGGPNAKGTQIVDLATGEPLKGVTAITIHIDAASNILRADVTIVGVEVEITTLADNMSRQFAKLH